MPYKSIFIIFFRNVNNVLIMDLEHIRYLTVEERCTESTEMFRKGRKIYIQISILTSILKTN
jgi:hypothetical protein